MRSRLKIVLAYTAFSALWIFGSDWLMAQAVHDPALFDWVGTVTGLTFVAVTSFFFYLLLLVWSQTGNAREPVTPVRIGGLAGVFFGLSLIVPVLGYSIFHLYGPQLRESVFADLSAIAVLKTNEIESWLAQHQANAVVLAKDQDLGENAALLLRNQGNDAQRGYIRARLDAVRQAYGYDAVLLDATGRNVLVAGKYLETAEDIKRHLLPLALRSGQVQRSDLYRDASGVVHLDYVVPLLQNGEGHAAILLHTPVERFLFPLIQRWPTPSASAETMLLRRDGDSVLYLNELRHEHNTALRLRTPLDSLSSAAMAVRAGQARHMEAVDWRGVPVLAAARPVAGTAWYVVAKIDREEALAPRKHLVLWVSVVALAAVAAVATAILLLWRQQQRAHRLELAAQTAESDRLLKLFFDLPFVGMTITSPATKHWLHVNDCLCEMLGYTREALMGLTWAELTHPGDLAADVTEFERVLQGKIDGYQMDKRFVRKDGAIIYATIDVKAVRRASGEVESFVATVQDISARHRMAAMQHGNALVLEALVRNEPLAAVLTHLTELIGNVLPGAIGSVLLLDADGKHLRRDAVSGLPEFFNQVVDGVEIGEGVGSCGTAAFRGTRVVVEDIAIDPLWENYRDLAAQANLRACWSEPILSRDSRVLGTFAVYFSEPRGFGVEDDKLLRTAANLAALAIQSKRTEHALRESEAKFRAIIDNEPECVKIIGPDGRLKFMNRAGLDMIEADDLEQVIGHSVLEIVTPGFQHAFRSLTRQVLQGGQGTLEFGVVGLKGTHRWLETRAVPLRENDGEQYSLLGITRDITKRKHTEQALRESEERFRLLFERNPAPMLVYERASLSLLAVNEAFQRLYGYSHEEALALRLPEFYPEPEKAAIIALIPHLHGHEYVGEWHHLRKDGTLINIVAHSHDIDFEGREARIAVLHDITERKRAEDALRVSEIRYRTLLEMAPFPVVITRLRDGILRYGNRRAEAQFGIQREQGIGQLASDYYLDPAERDRFLNRLLRETTVIDQELRLRAADGTPFWAQISAAMIEFEGEAAIFSSINDVSARKQAEDAVRQLNAALELRVMERTAQLQAVNKELESFAYSVSHDLKAPLRGIDGYSRLLLEDHAAQLDAEGRAFLANIRHGAGQMAQLIEDLLAYSRIERRVLQADQVDLPRLVETAIAERAEEIAARGVTMQVAISPQTVTADRDGLAMALRNLLDNALKFTRDAPRPMIEIGVRREAHACILWIRDNGIGFDMKFHERIFEIFQRLQLAEDFPGTGIGLAIVRRRCNAWAAGLGRKAHRGRARLFIWSCHYECSSDLPSNSAGGRQSGGFRSDLTRLCQTQAEQSGARGSRWRRSLELDSALGSGRALAGLDSAGFEAAEGGWTGGAAATESASGLARHSRGRAHHVQRGCRYAKGVSVRREFLHRQAGGFR